MVNEGRRTIATLTAAMMLMAVVINAPAKAESAASIVTVDTSDFLQLDPGVDGLMWAIATKPFSAKRTLVRYDGLQAVSSADLPDDLQPYDTNGLLRPLPDGSMGFFGRRMSYRFGTAVPTSFALVRLRPTNGTVEAVTELPQVPPGTGGLTVGPDGAVWFARSCADEVDRVAGRRVERVRLGRRGCGSHSAAYERGSGLTFDGNGALWLVNLCQGRIARVSLARHVREWHVPRISCREDTYDGVFVSPAHAVPDPRGGIAYSASVVDHGSGRVHDGTQVRFLSYGAEVFTPDGALWHEVAHGVERRDPDGSVRTIQNPAGRTAVSNLVPTQSGNVAVVDASYWKTYLGDSHHRAVPVYLDARIQLLGPAGRLSSTPLADGGTAEADQLAEAGLNMAPDGALWTYEWRASSNATGSVRLLRATPGTTVSTPTVTVRKVLRRVHRTLWLQISCGAALQRFCTGSATAAGSGHATPFAVVGAMSGAVPLTLGAVSLRHIRQDGTARMLVVLQSDGQSPVRRRLAVR